MDIEYVKKNLLQKIKSSTLEYDYSKPRFMSTNPVQIVCDNETCILTEELFNEILDFFKTHKGNVTKFLDYCFTVSTLSCDPVLLNCVLSNGVNIMEKVKEGTEAPYLFFFGSKEILEVLIKHGFDINYDDGYAMRAALFLDNKEMIQALEEKGESNLAN